MASKSPSNNKITTRNCESEVSERFKIIRDKYNNGFEPLTPAKIKKRPGLEDLSDKEAEEAVKTIKKLAAIFFELARNEESFTTGTKGKEQDTKTS